MGLIVLKVTVQETDEVAKVGSNLTRREGEILALVATGMAYKEIAVKLGLTEGSVKNRAYEIRDKLCARNMIHAVMIALRQGILELENIQVEEEGIDEDDYHIVGSSGPIHRITRRSISHEY